MESVPGATSNRSKTDMMKTFAAIASLAILAACGEEPAPEPVPTETATPDPVNTMPPPGVDELTTLVAEACPALKPVNDASCRSAGMGTGAFVCEFSLGTDEYLRNDAKIVLGEEDAWVLDDPDTVCAQGA